MNVVNYPNQLLALAGKALVRGRLEAPPPGYPSEAAALCGRLCVDDTGGIYVGDRHYLFAALPGDFRPGRAERLTVITPPKVRTGFTSVDWDTVETHKNILMCPLRQVFAQGVESATDYPACRFDYRYGALAVEQLGVASTFSSMPRGKLVCSRDDATCFGWEASAIYAGDARYTLYVIIQGERS